MKKCNKTSALGGPKRSRKKVGQEEEEKDAMPNLHNDIMSNIFTRVPADLLYKKFKYQCKDWFSILSDPSFSDANVLHSKAGILSITYNENSMVMEFMEFIGFEIKVRELNMFNAGVRVKSSSNGLVLVSEDSIYPPSLIVLNPITKENIRVPQCSHKCKFHELVFVPSTKEYKVVDMFYKSSTGVNVFHVRKVGRGWKESYCFSSSLSNIRIPCSYTSMRGVNVYWNERISIDGILYLNISGQTVVSFDVGEESVRVLECPARGKTARLIELGGFLSIVDCVAEDQGADNFPLDVWILKDINAGKWEKKFRIAALPEPLGKHYFIWHNVLGGFNDGEIIVFMLWKHVYAYDIKTRQWKVTHAGKVGNASRVHVNNLTPVCSSQ